MILGSYRVTGMSGAHSVASLTEAITKLDGVTDVVVDLRRGIVEILSTKPIEPDDVRAAVESAGYRLMC
jgi:copper chaperone CopZ